METLNEFFHDDYLKMHFIVQEVLNFINIPIDVEEIQNMSRLFLSEEKNRATFGMKKERTIILIEVFSGTLETCFELTILEGLNISKKHFQL